LLVVNMVSTPMSFGIAGALTVFYVLWMLYAVRHLPRASERLSLDESLTIQARTHHIVVLWLFAALSLFAVGCSIVMLVAAPGNGLIAIPGTALCGWALAKAARMLVLRYRAIARP